MKYYPIKTSSRGVTPLDAEETLRGALAKAITFKCKSILITSNNGYSPRLISTTVAKKIVEPIFYQKNRFFIPVGSYAHTTGAQVVWKGDHWSIIQFDDDTYFNGKLVKDIETEPYIHTEEKWHTQD